MESIIFNLITEFILYIPKKIIEIFKKQQPYFLTKYANIRPKYKNKLYKYEHYQRDYLEKELYNYIFTKERIEIIWVNGVGGVGKTHTVFYSLKNCKDLKNYDWGFLKWKNTENILKEIDVWEVKKNTIIVIDDILRDPELVKNFIGKVMEKNTIKRLVILLIEREEIREISNYLSTHNLIHRCQDPLGYKLSF